MMPKQHAAISLGVGLLGWWWSGKPATLPASLAAGTLIDLDHVADYAWYAATGEHRLLLPLHGYELALPLWWTGARSLGRRAAGAIVLAYILHLVIDEQSNRTKPGTYSLIWRALNQFRLETLSRDPAAGIRGRNDDLVCATSHREPTGCQRMPLYRIRLWTKPPLSEVARFLIKETRK